MSQSTSLKEHEMSDLDLLVAIATWRDSANVFEVCDTDRDELDELEDCEKEEVCGYRVRE